MKDKSVSIPLLIILGMLLFAIMLIPGFLLLLVINYFLSVFNAEYLIPMNFLSVLCVSFLLNIVRSIFARKK